MGVLNLSGSITGGPATASPNTVPGSTLNFLLFFANGVRASGAATGVLSQSIASPSAFVTLGAIGSTGAVTTADFFAINSSGPIDVKVTAQDGSGGFTTNTVSCYAGPTMISASPNKLITGVQVQGNATVEYFASGPA